MICPLCEKSAVGASDPSWIADGEQARLFLGDNQGCVGWCVLVLRRHVLHLDELSIGAQSSLFAEVARAARAIRAVFPASGPGGGPPRINYECLGNQVGHVHWHVIPRHADDPDPRNAVWAWPGERLAGRLQEHERLGLVGQLRAAHAGVQERPHDRS